jgi:hypothetical protein
MDSMSTRVAIFLRRNGHPFWSRLRRPLSPVGLLITASLFAGCTTPLPEEWKAFVPPDGMKTVVGSVTNERMLTVFYEVGTDSKKLRADFGTNAETQGFTPRYRCDYPGGRIGDRFVGKARALEVMIEPQKNGQVQLSASLHDSVDDFAALSSDKNCRKLP